MTSRNHLYDLLALTLACLVPQGTHAQSSESGAEYEDETLGVIFSAEIREGRVTLLPSQKASPPQIDTTVARKAELPLATPQYAKVSGKLDSDLRSNSVDQKQFVEVVVTFKDGLRIPRFPGLRPNEDRSSPANVAAVERAHELVRELESARAPLYDERARNLANAHSAREKERFWLIDGMVLELPLSEVEALSKRDDVQHVQYVVSEAPSKSPA